MIEAGGKNDDKSLRVDGERFTTFLRSDLNWGYQTVPQTGAHDRVIDYSRGLGLGGSTAVNFGIFSVGASGDYEEWCRIAGDESFGWTNMQKRLKTLETFHDDVPKDYRNLIDRTESAHGRNGDLHVGYATEWERDLPGLLHAFEEAGWPTNKDVNSGNPIGMGITANSAYRGRRTTAADLLAACPDNLTVLTDTIVERLIIRDKKAVGVEAKGQKCKLPAIIKQSYLLTEPCSHRI